MAEIEDERAAPERLKNTPRRFLERCAAGDEEERVEIALDRTGLLEVARRGERNRRVEAERSNAGLGEIGGIEKPGHARKADDREVGITLAERRHDTPRRLD